ATDGPFPGTAECPLQLRRGPARGPLPPRERAPALLGSAAAAIAHYPGGHAEGFPDTFKQLYLDVYGWITAGREAGRLPTFPTFGDGDHQVRLCEAIARSAVEERWVEVE